MTGSPHEPLVIFRIHEASLCGLFGRVAGNEVVLLTLLITCGMQQSGPMSRGVLVSGVVVVRANRVEGFREVRPDQATMLIGDDLRSVRVVPHAERECVANVTDSMVTRARGRSAHRLRRGAVYLELLALKRDLPSQTVQGAKREAARDNAYIREALGSCRSGSLNYRPRSPVLGLVGVAGPKRNGCHLPTLPRRRFCFVGDQGRQVVVAHRGGSTRRGSSASAVEEHGRAV